MADVVKTVSSLQLVAEFSDGDDRTISVENPRPGVTAAEINTLSKLIKDDQILLGDKNGADFTRIKKAERRSQVTRYLDLQ